MIPLELFCLVLEHVDVVTLASLCVATKGNRALYTTVLRKQWQSLTLEFEYSSPHPSQLTEKSRLTAAEATKAHRLEQPIQLATYIRNLRVVPTSNPSITSEMSVGPEEKTSIPALLAKCTSLRRFEWNSSMLQWVLDEIFPNIIAPVEVLRFGIFSLPRAPRLGLDWHHLSFMGNLKQLDIGYFAEGDFPNLFTALKDLHHLNALTLVSTEYFHWSPRSSLYGLRVLLDVDPGSGRLKYSLPPKLKSLAISDSSGVDFQPLSVLPDRQASTPRIQLPTLEDLFLECHDPLIIKPVVDWWDMPNLRRLSLPCGTPGVRHPDGPYSSEYSTALIRDNIILPMIARYSKTLQQITLLDIWQKHRNRNVMCCPVSVEWSQNFAITDLVCGTRPHRFRGQTLPQAQSETTTTCYRRIREDCFLYKHLFEVHQLHPFLIRLRIEQVHLLDDLIGTIFQGLTFPKLKSPDVVSMAQRSRTCARFSMCSCS